MSIITTSESLHLVASLEDLVPFLSPVKAIVLLIVQSVEQADDFTNQSFYLLKRSINLCNYINGQYNAGKCDQAHDHLDDLKHTLDKVHLCIQHLSQKTPLQRFLQRQEISESIKNAHQCLDLCVELFQFQSVVSLRFTTADHEAALQKDQAQLANTLERLLKNDANIPETLELRNDQLMEAVKSTSKLGLANGKGARNLPITTTTPKSKPIVPKTNIDSGTAVQIPGTGFMIGASDFEGVPSPKLLNQSTLATPSTSFQVGDEAPDYFSVFKAIDEYNPPALDDFSPATPSGVPSSSDWNAPTSAALRSRGKLNHKSSEWFKRLLPSKGGKHARGGSDTSWVELRAPSPFGAEDLNVDDVGQGKNNAESTMYPPEPDHKTTKSKRPKEQCAKFVIVGDGACGKTCLLSAFVTNRFPSEYNPTVFDNYSVEISNVQQKVVLSLFDTAGQADYDRLRPLSYPQTDVFLVCFSIESTESLINVTSKWIAEIQHHSPEVPVILVGCKSDRRADTEIQKTKKFVTAKEAKDVARRIEAAGYLECSALTGDGVRELFRTATTCALVNMLREQESKGKAKSCVIA